MDTSINTKPLLESDNESTSDNETLQEANGFDPPKIQYDLVDFKGKAPRDRYKAAYITFYLLGILTLLPWNFFVTANDYWMYKLRDVRLNHSIYNKTELQAEFTSYISIAATGPSIFFVLLHSLFGHRINLQLRMISSLVIILLSFVLTTALVEVDTDSWQQLFFGITLTTVVVVNIFSGILQAGLWGIVAKFSSIYISAVISGQALGGIFAAIVFIISLAIGASSTSCALLYFNIANTTIIISLLSYIFLSKSIFFKYHMLSKSPANTLQYDPADFDERGISSDNVHISLTDILTKIWHYGVSAFMCFTVTLSVYPAVTVLITSTETNPSEWRDKYFIPVVAFLIFSIFDYAGRIVAGSCKWPLKKGRLLLAFSFLRILLLPLVLMCNAQPRHFIPVLIENDAYYILITCLLAFTNGFLANITLINVPVVVDSAELEVASSMMAFFVSLGCAAGSFSSYVMLKIL